MQFQHELVQQAINSLPPEDQELIRKHYFEGVSVRQCDGIQFVHAKRDLHRIHKTLKRYMTLVMNVRDYADTTTVAPSTVAPLTTPKTNGYQTHSKKRKAQKQAKERMRKKRKAMDPAELKRRRAEYRKTRKAKLDAEKAVKIEEARRLALENGTEIPAFARTPEERKAASKQRRIAYRAKRKAELQATKVYKRKIADLSTIEDPARYKHIVYCREYRKRKKLEGK